MHGDSQVMDSRAIQGTAPKKEKAAE